MRQLGNSDVYISTILLGTAAIGGLYGTANETESIEAIQTSIENEVIAIDTSPCYGNSEEIIGRALTGCRNKVVISTKCGVTWIKKENPTAGECPFFIKKNAKPEAIFRECEESLKRLRTDRIDLYQIHWPDPDSSIEESWEAMVTLKNQGKVRAIGVSNYSLKQLKQAHAFHPVDSIQLPYSLIRRDIEQDIIPFCQKNQIAVLAYSPLEKGLLTGNVPLERTFSTEDYRSTMDLFSIENRKIIMKVLEQIKLVADTHKASLTQLIIAATEDIPGITGVIAGARNKTQALENAKALQLHLTSKEKEIILDALQSDTLLKLSGL